MDLSIYFNVSLHKIKQVSATFKLDNFIAKKSIWRENKGSKFLNISVIIVNNCMLGSSVNVNWMLMWTLVLILAIYLFCQTYVNTHMGYLKRLIEYNCKYNSRK
jgi:hypothetical protein